MVAQGRRQIKQYQNDDLRRGPVLLGVAVRIGAKGQPLGNGKFSFHYQAIARVESPRFILRATVSAPSCKRCLVSRQPIVSSSIVLQTRSPQRWSSNLQFHAGHSRGATALEVNANLAVGAAHIKNIARPGRKHAPNIGTLADVGGIESFRHHGLVPESEARCFGICAYGPSATART